MGGAPRGRERVGFRPPLTSVLPFSGVMVAWAIIVPSEGAWAFVMVFIAVVVVLRLRQLLILADEHLEVTVFRTRRIPWAEVEGFEPGSTFVGGTRIRTTSGVVHAVAPCSWWGGPALESDLEILRREARARA